MVKTNSWKIIMPPKGEEICFLSKEQVKTIYSELYSSKYNSFVRDAINKYLLSRDASTIKFQSRFDDRVYRFSGIRYIESNVYLEIGMSSYLDYLAFRSNSKLIDTISTTSNNFERYLPNVVGNVGILITKDIQTVGVLRSKNVSTYQGFLDFPGGHPEPAKVDLIEREQIKKENFDKNVAINQELFNAVKREIIEDLGVDNSALGEPFLFSIIINMDDVMKPDMAFILKTQLTAQELLDNFHSQTSKPSEVEKLVLFNLQNTREQLKDYHLTPIMQGVLKILDGINFNSSILPV